MPEFYMMIAQKIFFEIFFFGGGHVPPVPISYFYDESDQKMFVVPPLETVLT